MSRRDGILFRHGESVSSISIELSDDWLQNHDAQGWVYHPSENLKCDDPYTPRKGLSHKTVVKILVMLPNLHSIHFTLPKLPSPTAANDPPPALLFSRLEDATSNLPGLRHLCLLRDSVECFCISDKYVTGIIKRLPLLESLECNLLRRSSSSDPTDSFEWNLAQLSNLSRLYLSACSNVDGGWCAQIWPKKITKLRLTECDSLTARDLHRLLPSFAPNLIDLDFEISEDQLPPLPSTPNDPGYFFNLPSLTSLGSHDTPHRDADSNLLAHFQHCKELTFISEAHLAPSQWKVIADLVCATTWPKLKELHLRQKFFANSADWILYPALFRLRKFCHQAGIEFSYPDSYSYDTE